MNTELSLHGNINNDIEFFATVSGRNSPHAYFSQLSDHNIRFFAPGSELILTPEGIIQTGNGGTFCEYMFGVDQSLSDLSKDNIHNRLILLGAGYDSQGKLEISNSRQTKQSYAEVFRYGHAVNNFFFFVEGLTEATHQSQQKMILRHLGKALKRIANLNRQDDSMIASQLRRELPEQCTFYLIRLSNRPHHHFQHEFQTLYYRNREISHNTRAVLQQLADNLGIDDYQQERIQVDVMYHHRDNYRIIDEYKKVLIKCFQKKNIDRQHHARLARLKTLALRNQIPATLISTLDKQLRMEISQKHQEPEYTAITRDILHDLLISRGIDNRDMVQLLFAKQKARRNHDHSFEQLLLETGQLFDEQIRENAPLSLLEDFSLIISFFDRYDTTSTNISQIAFMENYQPSEELLHNILKSRQEFNNLAKNLFDKLFFHDIFSNSYLGRFGRYKLRCLKQGLEEIAAGISTVERLAADLKMIDSEEKLYNTVLSHAKERIRTHYSRYTTKEEQQELLHELNDELLIRGIISKPLDEKIFQTVIHNIKKEAVYLRQLLPKIITRNDIELRNDFLTNSGLDYFYIEELERDYFQLNQLDPEHLQRLRSGEL